MAIPTPQRRRQHREDRLLSQSHSAEKVRLEPGQICQLFPISTTLPPKRPPCHHAASSGSDPIPLMRLCSTCGWDRAGHRTGFVGRTCFLPPSRQSMTASRQAPVAATGLPSVALSLIPTHTLTSSWARPVLECHGQSLTPHTFVQPEPYHVHDSNLPGILLEARKALSCGQGPCLCSQPVLSLWAWQDPPL